MAGSAPCYLCGRASKRSHMSMQRYTGCLWDESDRFDTRDVCIYQQATGLSRRSAASPSPGTRTSPTLKNQDPRIHTVISNTHTNTARRSIFPRSHRNGALTRSSIDRAADQSAATWAWLHPSMARADWLRGRRRLRRT